MSSIETVPMLVPYSISSTPESRMTNSADVILEDTVPIRLWTFEEPPQYGCLLSGSMETVRPSSTSRVSPPDHHSVPGIRAMPRSSPTNGPSPLQSIPLVRSPLCNVLLSDDDIAAPRPEGLSKDISLPNEYSAVDRVYYGEKSCHRRSPSLVQWVEDQRNQVRQASATPRHEKPHISRLQPGLLKTMVTKKRDASLRTALVKAKMTPRLEMSFNQLIFDSCEAHTKSSDIELSNRASDKPVAYQVFHPIPKDIGEAERARVRGTFGVLNSQGVLQPGESVRIRGLIRNAYMDLFQRQNYHFVFKLSTMVLPNHLDNANILPKDQIKEAGRLKEMFRTSPFVQWQELHVSINRPTQQPAPCIPITLPTTGDISSQLRQKYASVNLELERQARLPLSNTSPVPSILPRTDVRTAGDLPDFLVLTPLLLFDVLYVAVFVPELWDTLVDMTLRIPSYRHICYAWAGWCMCLATALYSILCLRGRNDVRCLAGIASS